MRAQVLGVSSAKLQDAKETKNLSREATVLNNASLYQTRIFMAQHPVINNLSRAMSSLGHVARTALTITTAFSVASLAFNKAGSGFLELQGQLARAQRDQALALDKHGFDSQEYSDASEQVGIIAAKIDEMNQQMTQEKITGVTNFGGAVLAMGAAFARPEMISNITRTAGAIGALNAATVAGAAGIGGIGAGLGLADAFGDITSLTTIIDKAFGTGFSKMFNDNIGQLLRFEMPGFLTLSGLAFEELGKRMLNSFASIGTTINKVFSGTFNFIVRGIEFIVNGAINGLNNLIRLANRIPGINIKTIAPINLGRMQEGEMGSGTLKGAYGSPSIQGSSGGGSGGGTVVNVHVAGSLVTMDDVAKYVDQYLKRDYKRQGFER